MSRIERGERSPEQKRLGLMRQVRRVIQERPDLPEVLSSSGTSSVRTPAEETPEGSTGEIPVIRDPLMQQVLGVMTTQAARSSKQGVPLVKS